MTKAKIRTRKQFIPGSQFGRWTLLERADKNEKGNYRYRCRCECGSEYLVWGTSLRSGKSHSCKSCGKVRGIERRIKHGYAVEGRTTKSGYQRYHKYGVIPEDYDKVLASQANLCAICTYSLSKKGPANLDHCHKTGRFRGILCSTCNIGLGNFTNSPTKLKRAIRYLGMLSDARERTGCWI